MEKDSQRQKENSQDKKIQNKPWRYLIKRNFKDENEYKTVCKLINNDKKAFENLIDQYQKVSMSVARDIAYARYEKKLYGYEEDLVQEMWITLSKKLPGDFEKKETKEATVGAFYKYVESHIVNELRNLIKIHFGKKGKVEEVPLDDQEEYGKEDNGFDLDIYNIEINNYSIKVKNEEIYMDLEGALEEMSPKQKEVFGIAITTDEPYIVIGGMTDLSEKTVRNYMSSAYKILRKRQQNRNKKYNRKDEKNEKKEEEKGEEKEEP
ncbi:MAG: sigma-70 family RNA polymerase sigma factor [Butyrivibrio sp.]|nr:sigma-70 family RNA polymerase sigma factor [Butyrivibrio sp.]